MAMYRCTGEWRAVCTAANMLERRPLHSLLSPRWLSTGDAPGSGKPPAPTQQGGTDQTNVQGTTSTSTSSSIVDQSRPAGAWTEVVHEASGQTYWWNQQTGQTTALGEPKPGAGRSGHEAAGGGAGAVDPRAETPLPDKTGQFAAVGAIMGIVLGWASQFF